MLAVFLGLRVARDVLLFPEGVISPLEGVNIWRQIAISMHGSQFDALLLVMRDFDLSAGLRWGKISLPASRPWCRAPFGRTRPFQRSAHGSGKSMSLKP